MKQRLIALLLIILKTTTMKKLIKSYNKRLRFLSYGILCILMLLTIGILESYGVNIFSASGVCIASGMALIGNIEGTSDKDSAGAQIASKVWLIHTKQLDLSTSFPVAADGKIGTIPLQSGEYMHYFESIEDSQEDKSAGTKGDVTTEVKNTFSFILGGNKRKAVQFLEDLAGESFIIIYQMAGDRKYYVLGNDLKPMKLQSFERTNNKTQRSVTLTFENTSFVQPLEYTGNIITQEASAIAADATSVAVSSADVYKTSSVNTQATVIAGFTGIAAADVGRTITIQGGGGTYPSKISSTTAIILKDDAQWTGNAGSSIVLRVFDETTFVEESRIQTA